MNISVLETTNQGSEHPLRIPSKDDQKKKKIKEIEEVNNRIKQYELQKKRSYQNLREKHHQILHEPRAGSQRHPSNESRDTSRSLSRHKKTRSNVNSKFI